MTLELANRLTALRKQHGYSQEELAEKLCVSRQAISKWERGEASPDTDNLIELAKLYNISLDELVGLKNTENASLDNEDSKNEQDGSKSKASVNISKDGIHIIDGDDEVHISGECVEIKEGSDNVTFDGPIVIKKDAFFKSFRSAFTSIYAICCTIAFIVLGFAVNAWVTAWILFVTIPFVDSIFEVIKTKKISRFNYPVFITAVYLFICLVWPKTFTNGGSLWHPFWVLFLTIPIFYIVAGFIEKRSR